MLKIIFLFSLIPLFTLTSAENDSVKRINAHMIIKDYYSACEEAYRAMQKYPQSKPLRHMYLKALAKTGDEKAMFAHWNQYLACLDEEDSKELMETMAWAVIEKGSNSTSPIIRVMAMLGAFFSQEGKGVAILLKDLRDSNSLVRSLAVQLSSEYPDFSLKKEILKIFKEENKWNVKLEAIKAIGKMNIEEAVPELVSLLAKNETTAEETVAAISSLVILSDKAERKDIQQLIQSNRAGLRLFACELVAHFEQIDDLDLLVPLLKDNHAEIRAKAIQTMGLLRVSSIKGQSVVGLVEKFVSDADTFVATSAAWALTINSSKKGLEAFKQLLKNDSQEVRVLASGALAVTGKYGVPLLIEQSKMNRDPYVRMNLAIGLISQRQNTSFACDCLYLGLSQENKKWMWIEKGIFRALAPSTAKYQEGIPNYPEVVNQLARLEILNILAIMHYPKAQEAIRSFLQKKSWGISILASAVLLTEGDETAVDIVKQLLDDKDQQVRVQAALVLALWGQGESAVTVLQEAYFQVHRELKERILEGLAKIGTPSAIPFLVERLQEPYQSLRIVAASALLACLNK